MDNWNVMMVRSVWWYMLRISEIYLFVCVSVVCWEHNSLLFDLLFLWWYFVNLAMNTYLPLNFRHYYHVECRSLANRLAFLRLYFGWLHLDLYGYPCPCPLACASSLWHEHAVLVLLLSPVALWVSTLSNANKQKRNYFHVNGVLVLSYHGVKWQHLNGWYGCLTRKYFVKRLKACIKGIVVCIAQSVNNTPCAWHLPKGVLTSFWESKITFPFFALAFARSFACNFSMAHNYIDLWIKKFRKSGKQ